MAARSPGVLNKVENRSERIPRAPCALARSRVISVSPRDVSDAASEENALAARLESLVRAAAEAVGRLEISEARERSATKAAVHLQERLRLGARMLQAFQVQLARAENVLRDLKIAEEGLHHTSKEMVSKLIADAENVLNDRMERFVCSIQTPMQSETVLTGESQRISFRQ